MAATMSIEIGCPIHGCSVPIVFGDGDVVATRPAGGRVVELRPSRRAIRAAVTRHAENHHPELHDRVSA